MHCAPLSLNPEFRVTRNFQRRGRPFTIVLFHWNPVHMFLSDCVNTFPVYHCIVFLCYFVYIRCIFVKLVVWSQRVQDEMATFSHRREGRPKLPGSLKSIRLRESDFNLWRGRKHSLGFEGRTDSEFGEFLLHWRWVLDCMHAHKLSYKTWKVDLTLLWLLFYRGCRRYWNLISPYLI